MWLITMQRQQKEAVVKDGGEQVIPLKAAQAVGKLSGLGRMLAVVKHYILHQD